METDIKKIKRIARIQGAVICFVVMLVLIAVVGIQVVRRANYNYYNAYIGLKSNKEAILDKESYNKLSHLYEFVTTSFLFDYDKEDVVEGIYKGMFEALGDEYSEYYTAEEYKEMMESSSGVFEGIGAYLQLDVDRNCVYVVRTIKDSPAEAVGVESNDYIIEVDGEDMQGASLDSVVSKIRGPKGTTVHIKFWRADDFVEYDIERNTVYEDSVHSEVLEDNIGLISISSFDDDTNKEFESNLKELTDQKITSLIIDLRSNGGGYVDTAVDVADQILGEGTVVTLKSKTGQSQEYRSDAERKLDLPIVVLIDGNTASASEILTGALRDYGVATTVGTRSFGKGIVQDVIDLEDGSGIKITAAEYFTPDGECIHKVGIEPDIMIEFDRDAYLNDDIDNQLEKAKEVVKGMKK